MPFALIEGGVTSLIHVTVLDVVDVLPQPSLAVNVLIWVLSHPLLLTDPSLCVIVVGPHASVAVALPKAKLISDAAGLQPRDVAVPLAVTEGGVRSLVHETVLEVVDVLSQPSLAVKTLV